jgi:putative membrane protein
VKKASMASPTIFSTSHLQTDQPFLNHFSGGKTMKTAKFFVAALGLAVAAASHADVSKKDQEFMTKAAAGGLYEVQAGTLAQQKGQAEGVKSFGSMLVKDHSAANEELKALAASKGVSLPSAMTPDKKKRLDSVSRAKNFDKEFVDEVGLDDHKKDISLFEKASKNADDAEVKAFAAKTLPTLKAHRTHAEDLKKALNP